MKNFFYGSEVRRLVMRFVEIFVLAGVIGVFESGEFISLLPAAYVGLLATAVKFLRSKLVK